MSIEARVMKMARDESHDNIAIEEVLRKLESSREGLTTEVAEERLRRFGSNDIFRVHDTTIIWFILNNVFSFRPLGESLWDFLNLRIIASSIVFLHYPIVRHKFPWVCVLIHISVMATICYYFIMKMEVDGIIDRLLDSLAWNMKSVKVLRSGRWTHERPSNLVPGDVIIIEPGDVVPADVLVLEGDSLQIDQDDLLSAQTGRPAQLTKQEGDVVCYDSCCEKGTSQAVVVSTNAQFLPRKSTPSIISNGDKYLDKVLATIRNLGLCLTAVAILVEVIFMRATEHRGFNSMIESLVVLVIGGIPITLRWTTLNAISEASNLRDISRHKKGAIIKRMHVVKEMAEMDVLCICLSGPFMSSELLVLKDMIEVLADGVDSNFVILMAARACHPANRDALYAALLKTLDDPDEVYSGIRKVSFQYRIPESKLPCVRYTYDDGRVLHVCKGDPLEILNFAHNTGEIEQHVQRVVDYYRDHGWQSVAVACRVSDWGQWEVVGLIPLFFVPRYDNADVIRRASDLGISVKIVTADRLDTAKEICRFMGMNTNLYPVLSLIENCMDVIETADGFSDVLPEDKYEIITQLQSQGHICGMIGQNGVDVSAMKKADIGIAAGPFVSNSIREASDIVFTAPAFGDLDGILRTVLTCRTISKRIKAYCIYNVATTIHMLLSFLLFALIWKFVVPPMLMLLFVVLNDALNRVAYASYEVKPSSTPDRWKLAEVLKTGILLGVYFSSTTVLFFSIANHTNIFQMLFGVSSLKNNYPKLATAMYLQISASSQKLALFTQSRHWCGSTQDMIYVLGFTNSQMVAILIAVCANNDPYWPGILKIGLGWVGVIWFFNIIFYVVLLVIKVFIQRVRVV